MEKAGIDAGVGLAPPQDRAETRRAVMRRRDELFRSGWRNPRQLQPLTSRSQDHTFKFLIEWCEEFEEVMSKQRTRLADPTPRM